MYLTMAFSLTPGQAIDGVIDYGNKEGRDLYKNATSPLDAELYDCKPDGFYQFMQSLDTRASEYGWSDDVTGILWIPEIPSDITSDLRYIVEEYGTISFEILKEHEDTYVTSQSRVAQDNRMLYACLMNSISKDAKKKITIWRELYTLNNYFSGLLLLKVLIRESHLDTNATVTMIITKLSNLDVYIHTIGNDITKFNGYIRVLVDSLSARREITNDLLTNLFKGYLACSDKTFVDYIARKQEKYDEGESLTSDEMMNYADTKYRQLKDKNTWEAPSAEEEKILALKAKLKKMEKRGIKGTTKDDRNKTPVKKVQEKPKWSLKKPEGDLKKPREYNGKKWYWCSSETGGKCDGKYRIHKPSDCQGRAFVPKITKDKNENANNQNAKKVKISEALQSILKKKDDYDDDE